MKPKRAPTGSFPRRESPKKANSRSFCSPLLRNTLALCWLGLVANSASGDTTLTVGPNVNVSKASGNNAEEMIVINPNNPNNPSNLFVSETWSLVSKYSLDAGVTWLNSNLSALPSSIGDVAAAWDQFGNLFYVRFGPALKIVVGLSINGGASFSLLYTTTSSNNDQPSVAVGPSGTPGQGSVWITYTDSSGRLVAQGAAVNGLGSVGTWSAAQIASTVGDFGDIAVGPTGQVMVVYQDQNTTVGPDTIKMNLDASGVGTGGFGTTVNATTTQVGSFAPIPAQPIREIDAECGLAWDRSGGPHQGRVYMVYTDRPTTSSADTDIYVRYSDNNGSTWSSRVRVNDDTVGNGKSQFMPRIALDQTTGNIAVSFYDCRNSAGNNTAEVWATVSTDGGLTFLPNVKVSAGVSSALVSAIAGTSFDYGDYTGLAFHAGTFYPCWADNSNSTGDNPNGAQNYFDIYTAKVTVNMPFSILNPRFTNGNFVVTVRTVAGKNYYLESSATLVPTSWSSSPAVPGDGSLKNLVDTNAVPPGRSYRVRAR
jgi:hypothetical protein